MNNKQTVAHQLSGKSKAIGRAARQVLALLEKMPHGVLEMRLPDGQLLHFSGSHHGQARPLHAHIALSDWRALQRLLQAGDIGLAEGYIEGDWHTPDLSALLQLCIANRTHLERVVYGSWWGSLLHRLRHRGRRNTRAGSARNIHAHYDLGNDFYKLWLDDTMNYSSAWFEGVADRSQVPLAQAQRAKLRRALRQAQVAPGSRVLEVGCGWGGLAELAADEFGAEVTGLTLSAAQLDWGQQRMARAGLSGRVDLRLQDYRDVQPQSAGQAFDAVLSIEMFEAVGREYWGAYFDALRRCLKPGGWACVQTITIRDDLFERYVRSTDFIQQYIFPGGVLPSTQQFEAHAAAAGFAVTDKLAFGADYAETLRRWRAAFLAHQAQVRALGFDTRFMRIWEFYLAYCEAAFEQGNTDVVQYTLRRS